MECSLQPMIWCSSFSHQISAAPSPGGPVVPGPADSGGQGAPRTRQNRAGATSPASPGSCPMSPLRDECAHRLMSPLNHVEHPGKNYDSLLGALGPPLRVPRSSSRPSHLFCPLFILCRSSGVPPHAAQEPGIRTCSSSPIPPFEHAGDISGEQSRERKQQAGYSP